MILSQWSSVVRWVAVGLLFLAVYLTTLRPVKKQVIAAFRELPARLSARTDTAVVKQAHEQLLEGELEMAPEGQKILGLKKQLTDKVKSEPAGATKLVQGWIRETAR